MEEKTLLKIALIFSISGIILLFFISENIQPQEIKIDEISKDNINKDVKIKGKVIGIEEKEDIFIITLAQENTIKLIAFRDGKLVLQKGQKIEAEGEVRAYKGNLEIVANKIKVG